MMALFHGNGFLLNTHHNKRIGSVKIPNIAKDTNISAKPNLPPNMLGILTGSG